MGDEGLLVHIQETALTTATSGTVCAGMRLRMRRVHTLAAVGDPHGQIGEVHKRQISNISFCEKNMIGNQEFSSI